MMLGNTCQIYFIYSRQILKAGLPRCEQVLSCLANLPRNLKIERPEALDSLRQPTKKLADVGDFFPADGV